MAKNIDNIVFQKIITDMLLNEIEYLDMSQLFFPTEKAVEIADNLRSNTSLTVIDMSDNCTTMSGAIQILKSLHTNKTLKSLHICRTYFDLAHEIAELLNVNSTIENLYISHTNFSMETFSEMHKSLMVNKSLHMLDMRNTYPYVDDVDTLCELISRNTVLQCLNLEENFDCKNFNKIVESLKTNCNLTKLKLGSNCINEYGYNALHNLLINNNTLHTLNLKQSRLSSCDILFTNKIFSALNIGCNLKKMNFSGMGIGYSSIDMIAHILCTNETLLQLNLSSNMIGLQGMIRITHMLKVNKTLQKLILKKNSIDDRSATVIADALSTNSTLLKLDLSNNSICGEIVSIAESLTINTTLHTICLDTVPANKIDKFVEILDSNYTLTCINVNFECDKIKQIVERNKLCNSESRFAKTKPVF